MIANEGHDDRSSLVHTYSSLAVSMYAMRVHLCKSNCHAATSRQRCTQYPERYDWILRLQHSLNRRMTVVSKSMGEVLVNAPI